MTDLYDEHGLPNRLSSAHPAQVARHKHLAGQLKALAADPAYLEAWCPFFQALSPSPPLPGAGTVAPQNSWLITFGIRSSAKKIPSTGMAVG
ncbi:hypothetical protein Rleg_6056 (plasmid) [Rhizobium leguminosarum bv. trifolii WSM1325]|uniref:Uncharacterized protein n=1 Tax=Rhizobium leguminosarum bv. trifolii (strain WSM1325) TaxID=395491 RepID=C6BA72_RHILS|nr:hypothetical protein Rleg_6056 [Rhizobium leguminosarum bv. trifolii WSM1325]